MGNKKNILEICNQLGIGGTEKTLQIFCKYLNHNKYNIFVCGLFKGGVREKLIKPFVSDILIANGNIEEIKKFIIKYNINIVHWHSMTQSPGIEFDKSKELLSFLKNNGINIIETSPFPLYNYDMDSLLDYRFFVSKNTLLKFIEENNIKDISKYDYLYNPLDTNFLKDNILGLIEKKNLRNNLGVNDTDILVGILGRDDLWRWDNNFIYLIDNLKGNNKIKFIFQKIPEYYKLIIFKKGLNKNCIFLDLSSNEKDISNFHQIIDINLHDTRLGETFGLSIAESIFFNKIILTPYIDYKNKYIYDRNSGQFEFIEYYDRLFFYNGKKELLTLFNKIIKTNNFELENNKYNDLGIYNPIKILDKFDFLVNNNFKNLNKEVELLEYKDFYNNNYRKRENILIYFLNNLKGLYHFLINNFKKPYDN